jgi:hypothetical protein
MFDVEVLTWDPCQSRDRVWTLANCQPLTEAEADEMLTELESLVDPQYHGQGQALHGVRKVSWEERYFRAPPGTGPCGNANDCTRLKGHEGEYVNRQAIKG